MRSVITTLGLPMPDCPRGNMKKVLTAILLDNYDNPLLANVFQKAQLDQLARSEQTDEYLFCKDAHQIKENLDDLIRVAPRPTGCRFLLV